MEQYNEKYLPDHGKVGGVARRATTMREMRSEHPETTLTLDVGDLFTGSPYFSHFQGEAEMTILENLNYDACALGNHDVDAESGLPRFKEVAA
jgi:2',3'-cyclic-nucleotide 2'-phosphodiesterase (5'-nucleotidase family)